ncbi:MAG: DUF2264 domain-containing protein, partial [bacterium]
AWVALADRLACRVLPALARGVLKADLPHEGPPDRSAYAPLEAFGRLLLGLAPWFELDGVLPAEEQVLRDRYRDLSLAGLERALDPASSDRMNFNQGLQPLVDAALLCDALLRAPKALLTRVRGATRERLIQALKGTRAIEPYWNNWLLFAALVEVCLAHLGSDWLPAPIATALRLHETWYKGDGIYGDGPHLAWDYYNSIMIHPLQLEVVEGIAPFTGRWGDCHDTLLERARRYAEIQERLISPEGAYPPLGRSIVYRAGAFHHLAFMAWRKDLPVSLSPAGVRCALDAVLRRQMGAPGTFDEQGWLTLGFAGHQPGLADDYICTGSAYFVSTALLPLGLAPSERFWSDPDEAWTSKKMWDGQDGPRDQKLEP